MNKILTVITTTYRSEIYLENYFDGILALAGRDTFQFILVMNAPNAEERKIAFSYYEQYPNLLRIIEVANRESIGASLNRGFTLVNTPYCSFLDVDDTRTTDSYIKQIKTLENHPDADFTYGDFICVSEQGSNKGSYISTIDFCANEFTQGCHASPTQLFRSSLIKNIGGFDEQYKSGGDFEFQIRAAHNCKFKKTEGPLCYYSKLPISISASSTILQPIERTAIELRYGLYDKTMELKGYPYVHAARRYRLDYVLIHGKWQPLEKYVPKYRKMLSKREPFRKAFEKEYRKWLVRHYSDVPNRTRDAIKWSLAKMGLSEKVRHLKENILS